MRQSRRLIEDTVLKRCLAAHKPQAVEQGSGVAAETPAQPVPQAQVKEDLLSSVT